jgi:O-antigen/teichoic acid export membrane protein
MMNLIYRARKNIVLKFLSEVLIRSLSFLFVVVAARYLGDRDYGTYSLAYFFAGLLIIITDLGLNTVLIRDVSRDHRLLGRYAGNILLIKITFFLILLLLAPGFLFLLGYSRDLVLMILLSMVYLQCNHLLDFFVALTNSLEKMEYEFLIKGLYKCLVVAAPILFLWLGYGLWGLLFVLVCSYGVSCFLSGWIIQKKIIPLKLFHEIDFWKRLFRSAWPIGLSGLFMTVYARIDMVMLSLFGISPAEIGWYSISVKIIEMFSLIPFLIMAGLFPIFSVLGSENQEAFKITYQKVLTYLTSVSVPLLLTIFVLSDSWLVFFFGPTFANSVPSLKILIGALPLTFINYVLINTSIALNKERIVTWGSGLAVVFNIGINVIVLPRYGYLGASWTTVATEVLLSICFLGFLQRSFFRLPLIKTALKLGLSGGFMSLSLWGLKNFSPVFLWAISFMVYGLGLVLFRLVTREDWLFIKRIVTQPLTKPGVESR